MTGPSTSDPSVDCRDVLCRRDAAGRCIGVHCARCGKRGSANQGHWWSRCSVTRTLREFHFCCPDDCSLEVTER